MEKDVRILAIESSCDETAAAVIGADEKGGPVVLSSVFSSQIDLHAKTGGIVPEVASRAHMESIVPVISEALVRVKNSKLETRMFETNSNDQNSKKFKTFENYDFDIVSDFNTRYSDLYSEAIKYLQNNITHIAVTAGPGLIGSLLVGFNAAKTIAYSLNKPIIPVNHIEGHIYSAFCGEIQNPKPACPAGRSEILNKSENPNDKSKKDKLTSEIKFPILALTVSGGHTSLTLMKDHVQYETIGETKDDAAGEAFDKVARLLGLGYPGGPAVSKLASEFRSNNEKTSFLFPRPILNDGTFNFSFSGLKTAVLQHVLNLKRENYLNRHPERSEGSTEKRFFADAQNGIAKEQLTDEQKQEICAAFEDACVDVLTTKAMRAAEKYNPKTLVLAGGVAANKHLRKILKQKANNQLNLLIPPIELCGDNAAMIGIAAFYHLQKDDVATWQEVKVDSNLEIGKAN